MKSYSHNAVVTAIALTVAFLFASCSPRVSYSVRMLHEDPGFSGRMLGEADIALLPLLSAGGTVAVGELDADSVALSLRALRRDLRIVPHREFESVFPARFDRRELDDFYARIFGGEILAVKGMDGVWEHVAQPYIMAFSLIDGAAVRNMDSSSFKHVTVKCELWSRDEREVVWRASCKGVSDDDSITDARLIFESMRRLAETLPVATPNYGREKW